MASFTALISALLEFTLAVLGQWATLSTGGLVVAVWALWERKNNRQVPWPVAKKILVVFLFWAVFLAWKEQRQETITARNGLARQEGINQQLNSQLLAEKQNVRDEQQNVRNREDATKNLNAEITNRDAQITNRDSQIGVRDTQSSNLQSEIRKQQQTISDLLLQLGKAQQTEPFKPTILGIATAQPDAKIAPNVSSFLLIANKAVTPVAGKIFCDNAMVDVRIALLGAGFMSSGVERLAPNVFQLHIDSPPWAPASPLLVTVYHERDLGKCWFNF